MIGNSITVEHKNGTYPNYQGLKEIKVLPGEGVHPNQYPGEAQHRRSEIPTRLFHKLYF